MESQITAVKKETTVREKPVQHELETYFENDTFGNVEPYNSTLEKWIVGIACLCFFPLVYLIGRAITLWINS